MDARERIARPGRPSTRRPTERNAAEYALLGLIAQSENREIHGYDLVRVFAEGALGKIIRLESGMLYHYLKKLARSELITTRVEQQSGRPDRQVHALTEPGAVQLRDWLTSPVSSTREIRLDFLVKLYLARWEDAGLARRLVDGQRMVMERRADRLRTQLATPQPDDDDARFGESVLQLRLGQTLSALQWLSSLPEAT
jgi:DNA-binding PadR family transcriptional regulator